MRVPNELPVTQARLRGQIRIKAGPDTTDVLGLDSGLADLAAMSASSVASNLVAAQLQDIGSIESLDIVQVRDTRTRYAFGPNPQQAFQVVPLSHKITLTASKVLLKNLTTAEKVFNFAPSNLVFQQVPFTIVITDIGDDKNTDTQVVHYIFGCWFQNSTVKYDVTNRDDQRLINNVTITCGRVLTFDNSYAGSKGVTALRNVFSGIQAVEDVQNLVSNLPI